MKRLAAPISTLALLALSCVEVAPGPGDESMGNFEFTAQLLPAPDGGELPPCTYQEFNVETFEFKARFARFRDGGQAFITIGGVDRKATFDGQVLSGSNDPERPSTRIFTPAASTSSCCTARLTEKLTVALLSGSQSAQLGGVCPPNPLDGGVPAATPDGGVLGPRSTQSGFDAVTACGELVDLVAEVVPTDDCECHSCMVRYSVSGVRR